MFSNIFLFLVIDKISRVHIVEAYMLDELSFVQYLGYFSNLNISTGATQLSMYLIHDYIVC